MDDRKCLRASVAAERERCAKVADKCEVGYGSAAEGQNDPEFGQLIFAEQVAHSIAAAIRKPPGGGDESE